MSNIISRISALHTPYLPEFVEKLVSGEIDPFTDQVIVFGSGHAWKQDLRSSVPPEMFDELQLQVIQRVLGGTTFVRWKERVVYALICRPMRNEIIQAVTCVRDLANTMGSFHNITVFMGPPSIMDRDIPDWPIVKQFSGPFTVDSLMDAYRANLRSNITTNDRS
jgi:hypothetical protein